MVLFASLNLSFQVFGALLYSSILINHALTGNSQVIGEAGWWNDIVGVDKTIDVRKYTIVSLMCQVWFQFSYRKL
jgi:homoserine acetyltransferase